MIIYTRELFISVWAEAEKYSLENYKFSQKRFVNVSVIVILMYIAISLSIIAYFGNTHAIVNLIWGDSPEKYRNKYYLFFYTSEAGPFYQKLYWSSTITLMYLIVPILIIKWGFKQQLSDFGVRFRGIKKDIPIYLTMLGIMLPILYFISFMPSFQQKYPLYQPTTGTLYPYFLYWQIVYLIQFIAVEFFYRGFIIHGLKQRFGFYAVFISMIPYCMIHFGKPFPETLAAILAGIILGTFSLKSRSIVMGIFIHYSVALIMDILALYQKGWFS